MISQPSQHKTPIIVKADEEWDDTFQLMQWWKSEVVQQATVMVIGAGALGNETLKNLALLNIGQILIVDMDHIEHSNLCRSVLYRPSDCTEKNYKAAVAARRLKEINPNIKVKAIVGNVLSDVGLGVFRRMDAIIGCVDSRIARLYVNRYAFRVGKNWIDGGIMNISGQVIHFEPHTHCYECALSENETRKIQLRLGCADVARIHQSFGSVPTTPIAASIAGALQAQEALKLIHNQAAKKGEKMMKTIAGKTYYFEGIDNFNTYFDGVPTKEDCDSNFVYETIIESPLSVNDTVAKTLDWCSEYFNDPQPQIRLECELVLKISTHQSERVHEVMIPKLRIDKEIAKKYQEIEGEALMIKEMVSGIDRNFPDLNITLHDAGIPALHIFEVLANGESHFVELTADTGFLTFL